MKNKRCLESVGISEKEEAVYCSLIERGACSVSEIARNTGITRSLVHKLVGELIDKELVQITPKGKRKMYKAVDPARLEEMLEETREKVSKQVEKLRNSYSQKGDRPGITYIEGKNSVAAVFEDIIATLKQGDVYYRYSSTKAEQKRAGRKLLSKQLLKKYKESKIERFIITNQEVADMKSNVSDMNRAVKAIPKDYDLFDYDISQYIYGDKVAMADFQTKTAVIIESPEMAEFQKKIFKLLYRKL